MSTEIFDKPEILAADEHSESVFRQAFAKAGLKPGKRGWRRIKNWKNLPIRGMKHLFIACSLDDLTREKIDIIRKFKQIKSRDKVFVLLKGNMPSRSVVERIAWLNIRDDSRVHFAETDKENEESFVARLLTTLDCDRDEHRILDAWWEDETLVVVSPNKAGFKKIHVLINKLPPLQGHSKEHLEHFEIDEDGLFIYWPNLDVHLGWDQFELAVDRQAYLHAKQETKTFNKKYGAAIRKMREKSGLRQSDIKGLTARQVGRIETGECRATYRALCKLAETHDMNISEYMENLASLL
jgi:hypothetical protein